VCQTFSPHGVRVPVAGAYRDGVAEQSFEVVTRSTAPREAVFAVLADAARWSDWAGRLTPTSVLERPGAHDRNGVGAIRKMGSPPVWSREEIVEYEPPARLAYILLSGLPIRRYRSVVEMTPDAAGGTAIRWRSTFEPSIPGTGGLFRRFLHRTVTGFAERLATYAATVPPGGDAGAVSRG